MSSEQIDELQAVVTAFHASRPRNRTCAACGSAIWSEHETVDGNASWAWAGCHRSSSLTTEAWRALLDEKAQRAATGAERIAATEPAPRHALRSALERRTEAAAVLDGLERALPAARVAVGTALARHDAAVATRRRRAPSSGSQQA
jgi:hypothetical protein